MSTVLPAMRGLPSRSVVRLAGRTPLSPASMAGEPGRKRRSPAVVGASSGLIGVMNNGSASMLPPPSITTLLVSLAIPLPFKRPCHRLWGMVGGAASLRFTPPELLALLPQRMTLVNVGLLWPDLPSL